MKKAKGYRSFTLVELMVAVSIFAVIALCLYSVFAGGVRIWTKQEEGFKSSHSVRLVMDMIAKELRNSINYSQPETSQPGAESRQDLKFYGDEQKVSFITFIGGRLAKVEYLFENSTVQGGVLKKKIAFQANDFKEEGQDAMNETALLSGIKNFSLEYAHKKEEGSSSIEWKGSWGEDGSEISAKVPIGVRINLVFRAVDRKGKVIFEENFRKTIFIPTGSPGEEKE